MNIIIFLSRQTTVLPDSLCSRPWPQTRFTKKQLVSHRCNQLRKEQSTVLPDSLCSGPQPGTRFTKKNCSYRWQHQNEQSTVLTDSLCSGPRPGTCLKKLLLQMAAPKRIEYSLNRLSLFRVSAWDPLYQKNCSYRWQHQKEQSTVLPDSHSSGPQPGTCFTKKKH